MTLKQNNQQHGFHLVDPSPWPIISAFSAFEPGFMASGQSNGFIYDVCLVA